jgi:hypothetical protein
MTFFGLLSSDSRSNGSPKLAEACPLYNAAPEFYREDSCFLFRSSGLMGFLFEGEEKLVIVCFGLTDGEIEKLEKLVFCLLADSPLTMLGLAMAFIVC